jgi:predicted small metal-binding protein
MSLSLTCKHCGTTLTADSENQLVTRVQDHARTHDRGPELTPEHIRTRLDRARKASRGR